ncbi:MAG: efflux RND transporter periplasmic adaptor subunit [Luteolibacter sp.]
MRRWILLWIATTAALLAEDGSPPPVVIATAQKARITHRLELTGSVTARRKARLSARTSGLIRKLHVDAGQVVKTGDVLLELDDELAKIALERVTVAREQAEHELTDARRLEAEAKNLAKTGAFARSEAQSRETALKVGITALRRTEVLESEQKSIIERHRLPAPFDGVISGKLAEEGEWVQTGTPVVELVETGSLRLDVQAPQEIYARLAADPTVTVMLDAFPNRTLAGKLAAIVPVQDEVARTFLARIEMEDPDGLAAPGMSARAIFEFRGADEVLQVPRDAVVRFPDGTAKVWIVTEAGGQTLAASRDVRLGQALTGFIEILQGVETGAKVVVRGNEGLREGQAVKILPEPQDSNPAAR